MVAQILLGSPLPHDITRISIFSIVFSFRALVLMSHPLIKDFKTNLNSFYDIYLQVKSS